MGYSPQPCLTSHYFPTPTQSRKRSMGGILDEARTLTLRLSMEMLELNFNKLPGTSQSKQAVCVGVAWALNSMLFRSPVYGA